MSGRTQGRGDRNARGGRGTAYFLWLGPYRPDHNLWSEVHSLTTGCGQSPIWLTTAPLSFQIFKFKLLRTPSAPPDSITHPSGTQIQSTFKSILNVILCGQPLCAPTTILLRDQPSSSKNMSFPSMARSLVLIGSHLQLTAFSNHPLRLKVTSN